MPKIGEWFMLDNKNAKGKVLSQRPAIWTLEDEELVLYTFTPSAKATGLKTSQTNPEDMPEAPQPATEGTVVELVSSNIFQTTV